MSKHDKIEFGVIRFVHETLYGLFVNPYDRLGTAGLKPGQKVLEVGCGPGFFTIPAARIVGDGGFVYALDINPIAVEHVQRKVKRLCPGTVEVIRADANKTGLPDESVDVAFLFSVIHAFPDAGKVMKEMHRVLKSNGVLSILSRWSQQKLVDVVAANGFFHLREKTGRVFKFDKITK
jgi:ubiquinone/menaquinone biosynthesis C-methylase UbiE